MLVVSSSVEVGLGEESLSLAPNPGPVGDRASLEHRGRKQEEQICTLNIQPFIHRYFVTGVSGMCSAVGGLING
jgi:hypothetical protein